MTLLSYLLLFIVVLFIITPLSTSFHICKACRLRTFDETCVERRDQMEILRVLNCALSNVNEP